MKKNMGTFDRIIRTTVAAGIISFIAADKIKGTPAKILAGFAAIFISTSAIGWCPAYEVAGIDSLAEKE